MFSYYGLCMFKVTKCNSSSKVGKSFTKRYGQGFTPTHILDNVQTLADFFLRVFPNADPLIKLDQGTWLMPHPTTCTYTLGEKWV